MILLGLYPQHMFVCWYLDWHHQDFFGVSIGTLLYLLILLEVLAAKHIPHRKGTVSVTMLKITETSNNSIYKNYLNIGYKVVYDFSPHIQCCSSLGFIQTIYNNIHQCASVFQCTSAPVHQCSQLPPVLSSVYLWGKIFPFSFSLSLSVSFTLTSFLPF